MIVSIMPLPELPKWQHPDRVAKSMAIVTNAAFREHMLALTVRFAPPGMFPDSEKSETLKTALSGQIVRDLFSGTLERVIALIPPLQ
jgi:hypothetical protein